MMFRASILLTNRQHRVALPQKVCTTASALNHLFVGKTLKENVLPADADQLHPPV